MTREEAITVMQLYKDELEHRIAKIDYDIREIDLYSIHLDAFEVAIEALSADTKPIMTEEVREALMRLTMCAREECAMCKYKDKCGFEFQYNISTENMHTIFEALSADAEWIPCSERLPKEDEYVGNVCKYYLIQDEYGDMHVAHLSGRGWETIESIKALGCDVIAWMPLPEPYREDGEE